MQVEPDQKDSAQLNSEDNFAVNNSIGNIYGTLVIPDKKGRVPVVLLISGSGPTDRNMNQGSSLRTNSFYMLAKELSLMGIASLRYDKRGVGKSMSAHNSADASLDDFINDANLLINKLKTDPRFSNVIVLGHSEGAAIGLISSLQTHPAAYISLCGYANDMGVILRSQLKTAVNTNDYEIASQVLDSMKLGKTVKKQLPVSLAGLFSLPNQKFIISTLKYNSSIEIAKLKIPLLIIEGTTDFQVSERDARQLAAANPKAQLKILQGMNHILKIAPADRALNMQTYGNKDLPIDPELVKSITDFVNKIK